MGHEDVINRLIVAGVDVDVRDSEGNTPLLDAVLAKQVKTVRFLVSWNANPLLVNRRGLYPLKAANDDEIIHILNSAMLKEE